MIIGVDSHPSFQAIAFCVEGIGECGEQDFCRDAGVAVAFVPSCMNSNLTLRPYPHAGSSLLQVSIESLGLSITVAQYEANPS